MLILASGSPARARLLAAAGIPFWVEAAALDEEDWKRSCRAARKSAREAALELAQEKAKIVSSRYEGALAVGADQILDDGVRWFDKPKDLEEARAQLLALRGRSHKLHTAVSCVRDGRCLWQAASLSRLTMRAFSNAFLEAYLEAEGMAVVGAVGAYRLEGKGVQLFARVEGDHFAIEGLPLIELLSFLRDCGIVLS